MFLCIDRFVQLNLSFLRKRNEKKMTFLFGAVMRSVKTIRKNKLTRLCAIKEMQFSEKT